MSSIALVIFLVDWTLRIRRRSTRSCPPAIAQLTVPTSNRSKNSCSALSRTAVVGQVARLADRAEKVGVTGPEVLAHLGLEALDVLDGHAVEPTVGTRIDHDDLLVHRNRLVLRLLEQLGEPGASVKLGLGLTLSSSEPNVAKASSSRYWARSSLSVPDTVFIALIWAAPPTRLTEFPTLMAGRTPA